MNEHLPPNTTTPTQTLLVAGMHRSGTSAITRILNLLGAALPDNLMAPHSEFNPKGFWESQDVVSINHQLLLSTGSHWDDTRALAIDALPPATLVQFHAAVGQLLHSRLTQPSHLAIKDPRIARVLPLWIDALRQHHSDVMVIIAVRHPMEVAASLARREGFSSEKSVYLWLRHMLDSIRYSVDVPVGIVVYSELMQNWRSCIERLRQELSITWPTPVGMAESAIEWFLDKDLHHHQITSDLRNDGTNAPHAIIDWALQLYDALLRRVPDLARLAQEIHQQLAILEVLYAPLVVDYQRQRQIDLETHEALQLAQAKAYRHIEDLEQQLYAERQVYKNLEVEFNTKCAHVLLLQDEKSDMQQIIEQLQAQESPVKARATAALDKPVSLMEPLQKLERLVKDKQTQWMAQHQQMHLQKNQYQEEMARTKAHFVRDAQTQLMAQHQHRHVQKTQHQEEMVEARKQLELLKELLVKR